MSEIEDLKPLVRQWSGQAWVTDINWSTVWTYFGYPKYPITPADACRLAGVAR